METKAVLSGKDQATIHTGHHIKLKKCTYTGHCAAIWSVENAIQVLDQIGYLTDSDDCLPFAIRLVENGELIQIAEDNGEFGCGEVLADCLSKLDKYNVLVCVSRRISDSFVLDMYQRQILHSVREAGNSAVDRIHAHFLGLESKSMRSNGGGMYPQPEFDDELASNSSPRKASPARKALTIPRVSLDPAAMLTGANGTMGSERDHNRESMEKERGHAPGQVTTAIRRSSDTNPVTNASTSAAAVVGDQAVSQTKKKLRDSINRGKALGLQ